MSNSIRKKHKKGFTLVELIVVMAIIAILSAVAVPTTMHFVERAHDSNRNAYIQSLGTRFYEAWVYANGTIKNSTQLVNNLTQVDPTWQQGYTVVPVNKVNKKPDTDGEVITVFYGVLDDDGDGQYHTTIVLQYYIDKAPYKNMKVVHTCNPVDPPSTP